MILTVTAGYGHHATANAVADSMRQKGAEVEVVDVLEQINKLLQEFVARGYLLTAKYMREAYRVIYRFLETKDQNTSKYSIQNLVSALMAFKFENFIYEYDPDAIVCTHVTAAQIINELTKAFEVWTKKDLPEVKLKEFVGHTPIQVIAGITIGIANGCIMHFWVFPLL